MNIAFWNIFKKDLTSQVKELLNERSVDILGLAESNSIDMNKLASMGYNKISRNGKILIVSRYRTPTIRLLEEALRYSIIKIQSPVNGAIIVCFCHLIDQLSSTNETRVIESSLMRTAISEIAVRENTDKVLIIGDFNQNPYDAGITAAACFNATNDRIIAKKMKRKVQTKYYSYYYNPMWKKYAASQRPYGTYFYTASDHVVVNWCILDQVLISASLIDEISDDDIKIITEISTTKLLRANGVINKKHYSDHLPILLESNL